jgi:ACT domain-containing protein
LPPDGCGRFEQRSAIELSDEPGAFQSAIRPIEYASHPAAASGRNVVALIHSRIRKVRRSRDCVAWDSQPHPQINPSA